ncbi:STAS domain-containing protein [Streptomyces sp. NPDC012794]|uniref:STAS domain-containing protein n=1 Tax=Streptomyces sp. NPDC012794 TaxID=3364850 RepID=UPI0036A5B976
MHGERDGGSGSAGVEVEPRDGTTVVRPRGEMDLTRAQGFRQALLTALATESRPHTVVVDLRHLSFCDSSGLNALLNARAVAADTGQDLRLAAPTTQFTRLLRMTGCAELFTIDPLPPSHD